jgi:cancer susceptibility candidate protein 1
LARCAMAKKSKAEKKAEKAAEQARLEAERLEAERLEAERLEKERIERERQERIRKELERVRKEKEADTLTAQEAALAIADRDRSFLLEKGYGAASDAKEWGAFLECSDLPDVRFEAEINTYTAIWEAESETTLEVAATMCEKAAQICVQLKALISTCEETGNTAAVPRLHDNIAMLRRLTGKKLDYISAHLCQHAEEHADAANYVNLMSRTESIDYGMWVNLARQPRTKMVEYPDVDVTIEIPRALALANVAIRVLHYCYDELSERPGGSPFLALGGPFAVELLALPPPPKEVKQWTLRQVTGLSKDVLRLPYPIPPAGAEAFEPGTIAPMGEGAIASAPPLRVTVAEPKGVLIRGQLRVGWWDPDQESWREDGISEIERDEDAGKISFKTVRLTTLAFLQPRGFDFPFRSWSVTPTGENSAMFTVTTPTRDIGIAIGEGVCSLASPDDAPLKHLIGKAMEPLQFLTALASAGINLIPQDSDFPLEELQPKERQFEDAVYAELGLAAAQVSLKCSKWNQAKIGFLSKDDEGNYTQTTAVQTIRAVVQMCEDPSGNSEAAEEAGEAGPDSSRWKCLFFAPQKDRIPTPPATDEGEPAAPEEDAAVDVPAADEAPPADGEGEAAPADGAAPPAEGEAAAAAPAPEPAAEGADAEDTAGGPTPEEAAAAAAAGAEVIAGDKPEAGEEVLSPLDMLPEDRTKVCVLLSTVEDDPTFTEETYDDEGDVKEIVRAKAAPPPALFTDQGRPPRPLFISNKSPLI